MSIEYRMVVKREGRRARASGQPILSQWRVHEKKRFLLNEADAHFRCDHENDRYNCLPPVEWVRIERRGVGEWEPEQDLPTELRT